jgi:hypothetical protein
MLLRIEMPSKIGDLVEVKNTLEYGSAMTQRFSGCLGIILDIRTEPGLTKGHISYLNDWRVVYLCEKEKEYFFNDAELKVL